MNKYRPKRSEITGEPLLDDGMQPSERDMDTIEELYECVVDGYATADTIFELDKLIKRYPNNSSLKNYLALAYQRMGNEERGREVHLQQLAEEPEYLFARTA